MKKNYFFIGSLIGTGIAFIVGYAIMNKDFFSLFVNDGKYIGWVPILIGIITCVALGIYIDRRRMAPEFFKTALLLPVGIFMGAVLLGCFSNFAINGGFSDFQSWFIKPIFYLSYIGLPSTLIIGMVYYLLIKKMNLLA